MRELEEERGEGGMVEGAAGHQWRGREYRMRRLCFLGGKFTGRGGEEG